MKLVILTKPTFFVEEDKILSALFDEGLETLHLSKPEAEPVYSERLLSLLPEECYKRIVVHDHFYLKDEYKLKGIHLNSGQVNIPIGYRGNVSRTCHVIDELKEAKRKSNYVFLDCDAVGFDGLREASQRGLIDRKVYALGQMGLDSIRMAKDLDFGGVVIGDDLWDRFNIHQGLDYKELITHFEKLRKAVS